MKTRIFTNVIAFLFAIIAFGQRIPVTLTFTAIDSATYIPLHKIEVLNLTWGNDTLVYWPDTSLTLEITPGDMLLCIGSSTGFPVGVPDQNHEKERFRLINNYPNPVIDESVISVEVPEKGEVYFRVTDIKGRADISGEWILDKGIHTFKFKPGNGNFFLLTASWNGQMRSIKILSAHSWTDRKSVLIYNGSKNDNNSLKSVSQNAVEMKESGILDTPFASKNYVFQFATNIPCPGTPTVTYEGQVYNTIQVFSQCWMKENLNVGNMIDSSVNQTNNSIKEKYCYSNSPDSCTKYGGLYQWGEMLQYDTTPGTQGICPPGWHVPTDEEWMVLEGASDGLYSIGSMVWYDSSVRGFDAGTNLRADHDWTYENGNGSDMFGFSVLPGGFRGESGSFAFISWWSYLWTSSDIMPQFHWLRGFISAEPGVDRGIASNTYGCSIRCLRNE